MFEGKHSDLTEKVIGGFFKVYNALGYGFTEKVYENSLAIELRKTQRRVNALQYIFIPDYVEVITFIESSLEERERAEIFRLKLLKTRASRAAPEA